MSVTAADPDALPARPAASPNGRQPPSRTVLSGQIVVSQAAVAVWLLAIGHGALPVIVSTLLAAAVLTATWVRLRRRPLYRWLGLLARYLTRGRTLEPGASPDAMLRWLHPDTRLVAEEHDGMPFGVLVNPTGRTALLELDDSGELLVDAPRQVPPLVNLLPDARPTQPPVSLVLVVASAPAPALRAGGGAAATSYRQLTEGRLLASQRALLAVRVTHPDGDEEVLRKALATAVRRVRRRLGTARVLAQPAVLAALADLAHFDPAYPVREAWQGIHLGGLVQAIYRLRRWPDRDALARLLPRLWTLPAAATTVALRVEATGASMAIRLAAPHVSDLAVATQALRRLLSGHHAAAQRLDGEHVRGFAATLPIDGAHLGTPVPRHAAAHAALAIGGYGVALGVDRHGDLVNVRLFRPTPTRAMLVGGLRAAQLIALRAVAVGARVVVRSARPQAWEPFIRGASGPGEGIVLVPPGRSTGVLHTAGTPLTPQLVIIDSGTAAAGDPLAVWRTVLLVREDVGGGEVDALARADLVVLQPLPPPQAALAASALGRDGLQEWLARVRGEMVAIVTRRFVRWALLAPTQLEQRLIGSPARD